MNSYFDSLSILEKIFMVCALVGGILFLFRLVLQFMGHSDGDVPHDIGGIDVHDIHTGDTGTDISFKLLTFQGVTSFLMMFGLVGLTLSRQGKAGIIISTFGALAAGFGTVWAVSKLFKIMLRFEASGNIDNNAAIGQEGSVYLHIPPNGTGKIQLRIQGHLREYDAVTDDEEELKTGDNIKVIRVINGNVMVVSKI